MPKDTFFFNVSKVCKKDWSQQLPETFYLELKDTFYVSKIGRNERSQELLQKRVNSS